MKRAENLLEAIGMVDDELVAKAARAGIRKKKKASRFSFIQPLAAAAVLFLIMGAMYAVGTDKLITGFGSKNEEAAPADEYMAEVTMEEAAAEEAAAVEMPAEEVQDYATQGGSQITSAGEPTEQETAPEEMGTETEPIQESESVPETEIESTEPGGNEGIMLAEETLEYDPLKETEAASENADKFSKLTGLKGTVKEGSVSAKELTITYSNQSSVNLYFGDKYTLERKENNLWNTVAPKEGIGWKEVAYILGTKTTAEETFHLSVVYGDLSTGSYRIRKVFYEDGDNTKKWELITEFTIP